MINSKNQDLLKEMKKHNLNTNEWVLLDEATNNCKYSKRQIQKLAEKGNERIGTVKIKNTVLYNMKHILQYEANHQQKPILNPVWDEITLNKGEAWYPLDGYDNKYFITDQLRVIDLSTGQVLTPQPQKDIHGKETGYLQLTLRKNGKDKTEKIHRLTGKLFCKNVLNKDIFHHIDGDKSNNKASNILPVWFEQHNELHKILPKGKILKDLTQEDKNKYLEMVKLIKAENKQRLYKIPHLDYKPNENYNYFMFITTEGYKNYKAHNDVPLDCIVMECAEPREINE